MELGKLIIQLNEESMHSTSLKVMYNPTTIQYSKEIRWIDSGDRGYELREKQYDMILFKKLKMQLFFDFTMDNSKPFKDYFNFFEFITSETVRFEQRESSRNDRHFDASRPPMLNISWGTIIPKKIESHKTITGESTEDLEYNGNGAYIVTKIDWSFKMFDREGNVLRATADIVFEEIRASGANTEGNRDKLGKLNRVNIVKKLGNTGQ